MGLDARHIGPRFVRGLGCESVGQRHATSDGAQQATAVPSVGRCKSMSCGRLDEAKIVSTLKQS
ncbi:MAG TPA: hypothetical protein VIL65_11635 [Beijerinckiaceae bacterium]|jgi:hypothetical protein